MGVLVGTSVCLDALALFIFISAVPLSVPNTSRTPDAACLLQSFWCSKLMLYAFLQISRLAMELSIYSISTRINRRSPVCPHSNSKVCSTSDKLGVESLEFCEGRAYTGSVSKSLVVRKKKWIDMTWHNGWNGMRQICTRIISCNIFGQFQETRKRQGSNYHRCTPINREIHANTMIYIYIQ